MGRSTKKVKRKLSAAKLCEFRYLCISLTFDRLRDHQEERPLAHLIPSQKSADRLVAKVMKVQVIDFSTFHQPIPSVPDSIIRGRKYILYMRWEARRFN